MGPVLRRMAALRPDPAGDARRDDLGRGPALPHRISASIRSASPAASGCGITERPLARRAARPSPSSSPATSSSPTTAPSPASCARRSWRSRSNGASPRTRSSSSISTGSISAAAPTASTPPRGASSATARPSSRIPEAAIIAGLVKAPSNYSPTADAEAARSRAGVALDLMVRERRDHPGAGRRRPSRGRPARPHRRAAERHPLFHRLGAAAARHPDRRDRPAARRLDDDRSQHAAHRDRGDQRQCARRRAGRAGLDRPRRRGAGDGRRPRLCQLELQPRHPGDPPARLLVQIVRLS